MYLVVLELIENKMLIIPSRYPDEIIVFYLSIPKNIRRLISLNFYLAQYLLLHCRHFKTADFSRKLIWLDNHPNHYMQS